MERGKFITIDGFEGAGKSTRGNALHLPHNKRLEKLQTMILFKKPEQLDKGFASEETV